MEKRRKITSIFFLFILVLSIITPLLFVDFARAEGFDYYEYDDFEDDSLGALPDDDWYTSQAILSDCEVSDSHARSGSKSVGFPQLDDDWVVLLDDQAVLDEIGTVLTYSFYFLNTSDEQHRLQIDDYSGDTLVDCEVDWHDAGGYWEFHDLISGYDWDFEVFPETWYNVSFTFNFTDDTYFVHIHSLLGDSDWGLVSSAVDIYDGWYAMEDSCAEISDYEFSNWGGSWIDDMAVYYVNDPPVGDSLLPLNNTDGHDPFDTTLSVMINDTNFEDNEMVNARFYLLQVFEGFHHSYWSDVGNVTLSADGLASFTIDPDLPTSVMYWGKQYWWFVEITDETGNTVSYPNATDGWWVCDDDYDYFWARTFWTDNNTHGSVTCSPCCDESIDLGDEAVWDDHEMTFTWSDAEGDSLDYLDLTISRLEDGSWDSFNIISGYPTWSSNTSVHYYPSLANISANSSVTLDMRPFIYWNHCNYSVKIDLYESGFDPTVPSNISYCNFSIGTATPTKDYWIAIGAVDPMPKEVNAVDAIGRGLLIELVGDVYPNGGHEVFIGIATPDEFNDSRLISYEWYDARYKTRGMLGLSSEWEEIRVAYDKLQLRQTYYVYVGINNASFPISNSDLSWLYDVGNSDVQYMRFAVDKNQWYIHDNTLSEWENWEVMRGFKFIFHTYPEGESPDWDTPEEHERTDLDDVGDEYGVGWLGFLGGLVVVVIFAMMPLIAQYSVFKGKHAKNLPMPIYLSFTLLGVYLSFEMGFFPYTYIWIMAVIFAFVMVYILYNMIMSVKKNNQMKGGS